MTYPKSKFKLLIEIIESPEGKHYVQVDMVENDVIMKEIGLAIYTMKQIEQKLIDRQWDKEEGYEIVQ